MKKKLKMISKLFASITLLGCFGFGLFALLDHSQNQKCEVKADDEREPYNYDYRYTLQSFEYYYSINRFNSVASHTDGENGFFKFTYRMVLHNGDEVGYKLSFDNLAFNDLYLNMYSSDALPYKFYVRYNSDLAFQLNDISFDYEDYISYFRNGNNSLSIYVDLAFYYQPVGNKAGVLNVGLRFVRNNSNYMDETRISAGVIDIYNNDIQLQSGSLFDFNVSSVLITPINPYTLGNAIDTAIRTAYDDGISGGAEAEWYSGYTLGRQSGYDEGYVAGFNEASSQDSVAFTIFNGILNVALVPINFFLAIFNFEILGINLSGFIRALFTLAITIIVIRTIFGGKGASDS